LSQTVLAAVAGVVAREVNPNARASEPITPTRRFKMVDVNTSVPFLTDACEVS
jgi:hypothetical protein